MINNYGQEDVSVRVETTCNETLPEGKLRTVTASGYVVLKCFNDEYISPIFKKKIVCMKSNKFNYAFGKAYAMTKLHKRLIGWAEFKLKELSGTQKELQVEKKKDNDVKSYFVFDEPIKHLYDWTDYLRIW